MIDHRRSQAYGVAFLVFATSWLLLSSPWLLGTVTIPYDAKAHFHAQLQFLANALHTGQSPFWTPNVFGGSPQIADPQSLIFSPAILIAWLFPEPSVTVFDAYVLGLLAAGGLAVLMYFRDRGWHAAGGLIASLGFAFGASAAWRIQHVGQIKSYAMFAVTLWLLARALERRPVRYGLLYGLLSGLAAGVMLAEPDQVALLAVYVLAGYVVAHVVQSGAPLATARRLLPAMAAGAAVCIVVTALPLLLTYLFVAGSTRPVITLGEAVRGSLHPASLLTAIVGDLYGAFDPKVEYWGPYSTAWDPSELTLSQNMSQLYVGTLPLVLLLGIGWIRGHAWAREIRFFTIALVVMIAYALGGFTPLYELMYWTVPGVGFFRRPADATFLVGGLMSIVSGYLAHCLLTKQASPVKRRHHLTEFAAYALLVGAAFTIAFASGHAADAAKPILLAAACIAAARALVHALESTDGRRAMLSIGGIGAAMVTDLHVHNGPNESTGLSLAGYEFMKPGCSNQTIRFLKSRLQEPPGSPRRDRVELVGLGFSWPNIGLVHGFDHVLGYNPLRMDVVSKAIGAGDSIAGWEQRQFTPLFPSYRSPLADLMGLRYIASAVPIERVDPILRPGDLKLVTRTPDGFIYENPRALPRVMFVDSWQQADFEDLIETGEWPKFDPTRTVLLEDQPGLSIPDTPRTEKATSNVTVPRFENTFVEVDVTTSTDGFVLLNSVWHPWWRATVDGKPVEILKANIMFRAVQIPAGKHTVRFMFEPIQGAIDELASASKSPADRDQQRLKRRPRA